MNDLIKSIVLGVVRNGATAAGGWLIAHGYMQASLEDGFLGSVLFLAGLGFTVWDKFHVKGEIATARGGAASAAPEA